MGKVYALLLCLSLLNLPRSLFCFQWPWESTEEESVPSAEEILQDYGHAQQEPEPSYIDKMKQWTGLDTDESKTESDYFDQFRFWEKEKEEKEAKVMKAKLLSALDVNAEEIAKQRDFMNGHVDRVPDFEHSLEALGQMKYLLLPVRRFVELDNSKSQDSYVDYPRTYMRRLNVLLDRLYSKKDDIKLQESILATNVEFYLSPKFRFGVFYTDEDNAEIFEVINARQEDKLEKYWKQLDQMRFKFSNKIKEINELRKEAGANLQLFFAALDKVMGLINTQKQMFFDDFADYDGDLESEKKNWILEKVKENMRNVVARRERVLDSVSQISFILKELMDLKGPVGELLKDAKPDVQLIIIQHRQIGKGSDVQAEKYFDDKEQLGREKGLRNKVVEKIRKGEKKVEDIEDPDIGAAVLKRQEDDPTKEGDPYFHLRDEKDIEKELKRQEKEAKDKEDNRRGDTQQEDDQVGNRANIRSTKRSRNSTK